MTTAKARQAIVEFAAGQRTAEAAQTVLGTLPGASGSVRFMCAGNRIIVAKGTRNQKGLVAEHVVARLGQLLGAPVGDVRLVQVPDILRSNPTVMAMGTGLAHGTLFIENITDRMALGQTNLPENRSRFAGLCVLYSLAGASDHQLFYSTDAPQLVYSLDHGHFFPGGPNWTVASLQAAGPAVVDPYFAGVGLTSAELAEARAKLEAISDMDIANILAGPPPEWPFTDDERNALQIYLKTRRDRVLTLLPQA